MSPRKAKSGSTQATPNTRKTTRAKKAQESKKADENVPSTASNQNVTDEETIESIESITEELKTETKPGKKGRPQKRSRKPNRRKAISQERLANVINEISTTVGVRTDKRLKVENEESPEIPATEIVQVNEQRAIYSCKFCKKDFSSAFILCLHLRIHEKVGNMNEPTEEKSAESSENEKTDVSPEATPVKEEIIEEITLSTSDVDNAICEPINEQNVPKNEFIGIINKNFVENLRKNLSLAMNRQIN